MTINATMKAFLFIVLALGFFSFAISLAYHNIADGDLWARLAQGASIWNRGSLIHKDIFAFTPVLPEYIDHEWGAGLIFYSLLRLFGPESLLVLKIISAVAALSCAIAVGRLIGSKWTVLLLLALPCALAIFSGFVLVVRSQVFTYLFFAIILLSLEAIRRGHRWPTFLIIAIMILWTNIHGGFVAGLGIIVAYTIAAFILRQNSKIMFVTMLASICATFINPYGLKLWKYLIPALLHPRAYISEWQPMPMSLFSLDPYVGFRILFIITIFVLVIGWDKVAWRRLLPGLITLLITAYLALRHRRHAPFFGLSAAAFLAPYLSATIEKVATCVPHKIKMIKPMTAIVVIYGVVALLIANYILPRTSFQVWAPAGFYPVRECDILMHAKAEGNLVIPLCWGNYCMWRLYPRIKISQCGRYETIYPESTADMNRAFFYKIGDDWNSIVREYKVDYVILELHTTRLQPSDLKSINFEEIYSNGFSALWARRELASSLRDIAREIHHKETIQPLNARIPDKWWP